jgi:hypothetical protein
VVTHFAPKAPPILLFAWPICLAYLPGIGPKLITVVGRCADGRHDLAAFAARWPRWLQGSGSTFTGLSPLARFRFRLFGSGRRHHHHPRSQAIGVTDALDEQHLFLPDFER